MEMGSWKWGQTCYFGIYKIDFFYGTQGTTNYSEAVYHVILRGNACQKIFFISRDIFILRSAARHLLIRTQKDIELKRKVFKITILPASPLLLHYFLCRGKRDL